MCHPHASSDDDVSGMDTWPRSPTRLEACWNEHCCIHLIEVGVYCKKRKSHISEDLRLGCLAMVSACPCWGPVSLVSNSLLSFLFLQWHHSKTLKGWPDAFIKTALSQRHCLDLPSTVIILVVPSHPLSTGNAVMAGHHSCPAALQLCVTSILWTGTISSMPKRGWVQKVLPRPYPLTRLQSECIPGLGGTYWERNVLFCPEGHKPGAAGAHAACLTR